MQEQMDGQTGTETNKKDSLWHTRVLLISRFLCEHIQTFVTSVCEQKDEKESCTGDKILREKVRHSLVHSSLTKANNNKTFVASVIF
jgi:hypothetical protein